MIEKYHKILCCPDDGASVILEKNHLECSKCSRHFPIFSNNLVEMLPARFPGWNLTEMENKKVEESYRDIFDKEFTWDEKLNGWGDFSTADPGYRAFVKAETERIRELLNPSHDMIALDISGGVGNYSIPLSAYLSVMFHCELDVGSIQTAYNRSMGRNIFFIRTPYLKLPFYSNTFDSIICTDTLIRGWNHEIKLLTEIYRILKNGGKAIVDFHNKRLIDRNNNICYYNKGKITNLLMEANIHEERINKNEMLQIIDKIGKMRLLYYDYSPLRTLLVKLAGKIMERSVLITRCILMRDYLIANSIGLLFKSLGPGECFAIVEIKEKS